MTSLMLELPPYVYERLQREAERAGQPIEDIASAWLAEHIRDEVLRDDLPIPASPDEREQARAVLRAAGLLTELGPTLKQRAEQSSASLEEVQTAFARAGGKSLSEIVIGMRGSKD